jgi:putative tryptophan/tyrosine transport system substrate-binding protein
MRRREFITLLGGAAAAWPLAALGQRATKLPTVGLLATGSPASHGPWFAALVRGLRELGWIEGRTVAIEYRFAEGREERFVEIMDEFVRSKVDVIATTGAALYAAKQVTSTIPIVFAIAADPVGMGLIASLARPGGNITGLSMQQTDAAPKRLELLREIIPELRRLAIMANVEGSGALLDAREVQAAARTLGLDVVMLEVRRAEEIAPAFQAVKNRAEALYVVGDPLITANRLRIGTFALTARLPTMSNFGEFVKAGGLVSYGTSLPDMFRRAGGYVDKILRGAKPADLPVEQPTKFDLVINLITAQALGVTVPPTLLSIADEVIE